MRVYLIVANDGAILILDPDAPADRVDCAEPMIVEIFPAEPHDTIPCPPPEPEPEASELLRVLLACAWYRPPAGQA